MTDEQFRALYGQQLALYAQQEAMIYLLQAACDLLADTEADTSIDKAVANRCIRVARDEANDASHAFTDSQEKGRWGWRW